MKIIAISDTHKQYNKLKLPKGDILIHAGDIDLDYLGDVVDFNNWLSTLPFKYNVVIAGNHDRCSYYNSNTTKKLLTNAIYLENSGCEIEGIKIWGSPITPRFMDWYFMEDRDKIHKYWDLIPKDTDILITHGPPFGILDYVKRGNILTQNLGCESLLETINKIKPKYHIFGHIHYSYGVKIINDTTFINCSVVDEDYEVVNKPMDFEYDNCN